MVTLFPSGPLLAVVVPDPQAPVPQPEIHGTLEHIPLVHVGLARILMEGGWVGWNPPEPSGAGPLYPLSILLWRYLANVLDALQAKLADATLLLYDEAKNTLPRPLPFTHPRPARGYSADIHPFFRPFVTPSLHHQSVLAKAMCMCITMIIV